MTTESTKCRMALFYLSGDDFFTSGESQLTRSDVERVAVWYDYYIAKGAAEGRKWLQLERDWICNRMADLDTQISVKKENLESHNDTFLRDFYNEQLTALTTESCGLMAQTYVIDDILESYDPGNQMTIPAYLSELGRHPSPADVIHISTEMLLAEQRGCNRKRSQIADRKRQLITYAVAKRKIAEDKAKHPNKDRRKYKPRKKGSEIPNYLAQDVAKDVGVSVSTVRNRLKAFTNRTGYRLFD